MASIDQQVQKEYPTMILAKDRQVWPSYSFLGMATWYFSRMKSKSEIEAVVQNDSAASTG